MPQTELQTAKFFQPETEASFQAAEYAVDQSAENVSTEFGAVPKPFWERASGWISVAAAGAVLLCLLVLAIPYVTGVQRSKSCLGDWFLWLGGAKNGQTFDQFMKDVGKKSRMDFDAAYKASPTYNLDTTPMYQFNQSSGFQFSSQPSGGQFPTSPRR